MKIISTKVHGILDYLMGIILIVSPWLFGFKRENAGAESWIPILVGVGMIMYSIMTDYEFGLTDNISVRTHLVLDVIAGLLLAASPWIFGFKELVYLPHVILGGAEVLAALMTATQPQTDRTYQRHERRHINSHRPAHG